MTIIEQVYYGVASRYLAANLSMIWNSLMELYDLPSSKTAAIAWQPPDQTSPPQRVESSTTPDRARTTEIAPTLVH